MLMRDIFTVMKFTINDMIKRKSFIISTLIILILIVIGFNVPNLIKKFKDRKSVVQGKSVDLGGRRIIKKKTKRTKKKKNKNEE